MEFERTMKRVAGLFEIYEGKEVCVKWTCPVDGEEHAETDYTKALPGLNDIVICNRCGGKFIVVKKP